jgi:hypothetical protein
VLWVVVKKNKLSWRVAPLFRWKSMSHSLPRWKACVHKFVHFEAIPFAICYQSATAVGPLTLCRLFMLL